MHEQLSLDRVYREHGHVVLRRARQLLGTAVEAEDALHEVFLSLANQPGQFVGGSITAWLYRATTNLCLNRLRNTRTRDRLLARELEPAEQRAPAPCAVLGLTMRSLLAQLPEQVAHALVYHHVDDMGYDEIAEVMGCSRRHVGNLLRRGRDFMHERKASE
jgi:RNA polymerase sigma-70 factor (ECF subfamily)